MTDLAQAAPMPPQDLAVALNLAGRQVLVVGAGPVAQDKIARLLLAAARVLVVAPVATPQVQTWAAQERIAWQRRRFAVADVREVWLVIAATGTAADHEVFAACEAQRVLCNAVDVPAACSVQMLSQEFRGELTLAVGTSGTAPGLSGRLRREAAAGWPPDVAELVQAYAAVRRWLMTTHAPGPSRQRQRAAALRRLAEQPWSLFRLPQADLRRRVAAMYAESPSGPGQA